MKKFLKKLGFNRADENKWASLIFMRGADLEDPDKLENLVKGINRRNHPLFLYLQQRYDVKE